MAGRHRWRRAGPCRLRLAPPRRRARCSRGCEGGSAERRLRPRAPRTRRRAAAGPRDAEGNPRAARSSRRRHPPNAPSRRLPARPPAGRPGAPRVPGRHTGCRRRCPARGSRCRRRSLRTVRSGAESDSSSETGVVAPIVTRDPSRVIPASPAPVSSIARSGRSLPLVRSGTTIVPPPITVTPASKRETASSGDDGWSTSGAVIDHPSFGIPSCPPSLERCRSANK